MILSFVPDVGLQGLGYRNLTGCYCEFAPQATPVLTNVAFIGVTGLGVCAILSSSGGAVCWGEGTDGELGSVYGYGAMYAPAPLVAEVILPPSPSAYVTLPPPPSASSTVSVSSHASSSPTPTPTKLPFPFVSPTPSRMFVSVGLGSTAGHTCAVDAVGALYCWGDNAYNQLVRCAQVIPSVPVRAWSCAPLVAQGLGIFHTPVLDAPTVPTLTNVTLVATGSDSTCALTVDADLLCWGLFGNFVPPSTPTLAGVRSVAIGAEHVCAVSLSGGVRCWGGYNAWGELGNGVQGSTYLFTGTIPPPTDLCNPTNVMSVSAGDLHTCAVSSGSELRCWGDNT